MDGLDVFGGRRLELVALLARKLHVHLSRAGFGKTPAWSSVCARYVTLLAIVSRM